MSPRGNQSRPRVGFEKVRTGCQTCKLRRIKCDEARPVCLRCQTSKRKCEGYQPAPLGSFSWNQLLKPQPTSPSSQQQLFLTPSPSPSLSPPPIQHLDPEQLRCMSYFQHAAAPVLAGSLDKTFWTYHVPQVAEADPAARHAVLAISSLYEDFSSDTKAPSDTPGWHGSAFALEQYNSAIRRVLSHKFSNLDTLLTVSLLFTCIELLQGNSEAAIKHCRHGINVYNSSRLSPELAVVFSHLSIFPLFFGSELSDIPLPKSPAFDESTSLDTVERARETLHSIMARAVRLIRLTDNYRRTPGEWPVNLWQAPEQVMQRQNCRDLDTWAAGFSGLKRRTIAGNDQKEEEDNATAFRILEMRWLVSKIWTDACLHNNETIYDQYMDRFQHIIDIAEEEKAARALSATTSANFTFEQGFLPLLYVVVVKCRNLSLRLQALELMKTLSCSRETLWDADIMYAAGIRFIEVEHHITIDVERIGEMLGSEVMMRGLPPDEDRVRDLSVAPEVGEWYGN